MSHETQAPLFGRPRPQAAPAPIQFYIGIDPGTHCGWAVLTRLGLQVISGTWDLETRRHEGGGFRFVRLEKYIRELLRTYPGARVAYEEVASHKGTAASHIYGGIIAHVARICEEQGTPYCGIPVGTVKKTATGKGNSGKPAMVTAARKQWALALCGEDEADALWVAECLRVQVE